MTKIKRTATNNTQTHNITENEKELTGNMTKIKRTATNNTQTTNTKKGEMNSMKKTMVKIMVGMAAAIAMSTTAISASAADFNQGDVNMDGKVNLIDQRIIVNYIAHLTELTDQQKQLADYNNDGKIDLKDSKLIINHVARLDETTPTQAPTQAPTQETAQAQAPQSYLIGDVNLDGDVTVSDAVLISKYTTRYAQLTPQQLQAADINQDGRVGVADTICLLKVLAGSTNS